MRNKILLLLAIISVCLSTNAQIKIDFNKENKNNPYASGYVDWTINDLEPSGSTLPSAKKEFGNVIITLQAVQDTIKIKKISDANALKAGTTDVLTADGITGVGYKDGEDFYLESGRMAIKFTITGLSAGKHSIQAFHNNVELKSGDTAPDIFVDVNNVNVLGNIKQTYRETDRANCAKSYITFEVASPESETVILYYTLAESHETYTRNNFCINSLDIDASAIDDIAQKPYPANLDWHVETPNNSVTLSWTAAVNGADSHVIYFGTDEETVKNATTGGTTQSGTSITKTGLSPLKRYYWRVDEVKNGVTTKGDVWSFQPRRLAFPGADGAGKYAVGGRGYNNNGDVYHVTNLNDSGEGSLRYGIESATGPRTIVFDVAGVIPLTSDLKCNKPYITVAGQTAPGIGVLLRDDSYSADSEEGITRFMRFRFGHGDDWKPESGVGNSNVGNAAGIQTNFHIMDHCLLAWGSDETFASRGAKNITFQHSLIGESLNQNGHDKYYAKDPNVQHGYAATIGGETGSYHHNLLAHNEGRNWSMAGGLLGENFAGKMNIYNNVVYNWHGRTNDGGTHNGNFVNNYYKMMTTAENSNTEKYIFIATHEDNYQGEQEYYVAGNIRRNKDGSETSDAEGVTYKNEFKNGMSIDYDDFKDVPYDCWNVESKSVSEIESAQSAFKNVLSDVGCNYKQLDNNEKRLIEETLKGTYSKTGSRSGLKGHIDKESDSEGWDGLGMIKAERPTGWDSDKDGIPAWFEGAKGWSDAAANNNADSDGDYYTDLEEYLNWVAVPHFYNTNDGTVTALETGTNHTITLADYFAGYTSPTYTVVSNGGATTSISNNGVLTYNFPANASKLATIQVKATQDGISLTRSFNFFIDGSEVDEPETPVVTPEGTEYMIAASTNTGSNTTSEYNFTHNGAQFTVTNTKSKGYSAGNEDGVKYSAGVQYTITIPEGCSVNGIKFSGYNNYKETNAYIGEVNGTTYESSKYTYPMKDGEGNSTSKEYTIQFADPVTNSLTFTPQGNQCVWAITLYVTGTPAVTPDDDTELAPAFPGAEGSGRYAQGGRGTDGTTNVYHVTSLKDDKNVVGTLRWALAQDGPRTIVFDVSGYIDLASDLKIPNNTTIAGQTAPAPGITLRYYTVNTSDAENVIIRYMRFRRSQVKDVNDGADAAWGRHGKNIILDHCSFSWSIDEVASFYDNRDFTMQWCVVAEGLNSGHEKGTHSYGGIWGGKNATFHHNMITNVHNRAPRLCGARFNWDGYDTETYANSVQAERVDVRNNLYYNWGQGNGAYGGAGGYHNLVNNYYKDGPGTKNTSRVFQGSANDSKDSNGALPDGLPGLFYIDGNYVRAQSTEYDWQGFIQDSGTGVNTTALTYTDSQGLYGAAGATVSIKLDEEVDMADVTTHTAANAYDKILLHGGASLYRDAVDKRLMSDTESGEATYPTTSDANSTPGIVDVISDPAAVAVAGQPSFPMLAVVERPTNWDTDGDGIPDAWEDANGLDKNNSADGNLYTLDTEKGWYTNLEVYLNSIVEDITMAQTEGATIEIDEYYPEWKEPTVESLTEFVLSNETHSSGSANVWTFSNGFGVTGKENRTYAPAGNYIKYSDGYEYTISVPSNVTVYKVKVEGYANAAVGTTSYLEAFGTQTFDATRYVFPSGNASVNRASYEFTLLEAVTGGTLKIQATGAQTCLIVTLYGKENAYDLDEVANEMTVEEGSSVDVEYTIDGSTYKEANDDGTQYTFVSGEETFVMTRSSGKDIEYGNKNILENSIKYSAGQTFTISIPDGIAITNFIVTGYTNKDNSEGGISTINGETVSYTFPSRTDAKTETHDIEMNNVTGELSFVSDLQCCYVITLKGTKTTGSKKTTVTLDEMATVHNLDAADNVTVEMKRGLTAGAWNTFCVPFDLTKAQLQTALNGSEVEIVEYTSQEGTMLYFTDTDKIVAGTPYLIKPATFSRTYDECKTTPITFEGVNLVAADVNSNNREVVDEVRPSAADYSFVGTYVRYIMETDGTELGLNSKNKLAKPAASTNIMRGLRGFFRYNAGNGAGAKVVINGTLTSIDEIDGGTAGAKGVYHVSGRYVRSEWNNGSGLPRGLYIVNGQKMVK